jgi:hypothetical protein
MMTNRERLLAVLDGKQPDRIPWIPRMDIWYATRLADGNLPARYQNLSLSEIEKKMGVGSPARAGRIFVTRYQGVDVTKTKKGEEVLTEYSTPYGRVTALDIKGENSEGFFHKEPLLKRIEDYDVVEYIWEHTFFDPAYEDYLAYEQTIGNNGYPMVFVGDAPFHHFLLRLAGYNRAYYELADHLPRVERLLKVMEAVEMDRLWPVVLDSPARLLLHGLHFGSQMTPPRLFERYIKPYYQQITPGVRSRGKHLAYHADADAKAILSLIKESGFSMAECMATAPLTEVTIQEARSVWGNEVIIFGGVPSVILEESTMSDEEFESYMLALFQAIAPGNAFVMGVSDNVMPNAKIERLERITEMIEEYGRYPARTSQDPAS